MKKFFTFLLPFSLLASAALSSCSDGCTGNPDPTPELPDGYTYATENTSINDGTVTANMLFFGTSTVTTVASGATFTDGKALFELVADGEGKVRILMHETRFAAEMPALEMESTGHLLLRRGKNHRLERRLGHTGNQGHALRQIRNHQPHGRGRKDRADGYLHLRRRFRCKLSGTPDYRKIKLFQKFRAKLSEIILLCLIWAWLVSSLNVWINIIQVKEVKFQSQPRKLRKMIPYTSIVRKDSQCMRTKSSSSF